MSLEIELVRPQEMKAEVDLGLKDVIQSPEKDKFQKLQMIFNQMKKLLIKVSLFHIKNHSIIL